LGQLWLARSPARALARARARFSFFSKFPIFFLIFANRAFFKKAHHEVRGVMRPVMRDCMYMEGEAGGDLVGDFGW
jgi:hypothetical protein